MLIAGLQHAALTNPAIPKGMAMVMALEPKLVTTLSKEVRMAPRATQRRSP